MSLALFALGGARVEAQTAPSLPLGSTVGRFELNAPNSHEFVLQGTLPLPRGTLPRGELRSLFGIRDSDGTLRPAQTEIVSRYAAGSDGADVVEIATRVHRPLGIPPQARIGYDIVWLPHPKQSFQPAARLQEILGDPRSIQLRARDVFGNLYVYQPLRGVRRDLRNGEAIQEWRTHGSLMPAPVIQGTQGTLPHLLGAHSFMRLFKDESLLEFDLLLHNGHSGVDDTTTSDDPLGDVYFESLELWLPKAWRMWFSDGDSAAGPAIPAGEFVRYELIRPLDDGKLHLMPRQAQTQRRMVIGRKSDEKRALDYVRDQNLGFSRRGVRSDGVELWSWWNPLTARYFPQRTRLPELDHLPPGAIAQQQREAREKITDCLRTGQSAGYPILSPALGWAHPWGIDDGGMAGGDEIVMIEGLRALEACTNDGWRLLTMRHRMLTDRQPVAMFDPSGDPSDYRDWIVQGISGPWLPIWCFLRPILEAGDPFGFLQAPQFQVDAVNVQGRKPPYEASLRAHKPIDLEHLVRYTAPAKALAWIGNDSLAKLELRLHADLFRMGYNDLPNSDYGHYIPTGLAWDEMYVDGNPGLGFVVGRLEGWGLDVTLATYALEGDTWRAATRPWYAQIVDVYSRGQAACSGFLQAMVYEQLFGGQYRARQSIEAAILEQMLVSMRNTVFDGRDPVRASTIDDILRESFYAMVTYPGWSDQHNAPWSKLAVGDNNFSNAPYCHFVPPDGVADGGDGYQCWSSLMYGSALTNDPLFLQRAAEMIGGPLLPTLQAAGLANLENRAALLAFLQRAF